MDRLLLKLAVTAVAGVLLYSNPICAQNPPPQPRAEHVEIIKGPALEISHDDLAIVRWTTTNHIRLNRAHSETIFRVRMDGLKPQTTYYYKVTSTGSGGESDGVESAVNHFTTAAPGQVTSAFPQPE